MLISLTDVLPQGEEGGWRAGAGCVPVGTCHPDVVGLRPTKVTQNRSDPSRTVRLCVNCGRSLRETGATAQGDAVAWYWHCRPCAQLAAQELELVADQPGGSPIRIYRCRLCGSQRSCRPGWLTRCHLCLDERSHSLVITDAAMRFRSGQSGDAESLPSMRLLYGLLGRDADQPAVEASAALALATVVRRAERPGWDVVATDVHGLPWTGSRTAATSHGTWATHQVCGTVAKLRPGSIDCPVCGPAKGSRTHLARRDDPYLLYLVAHRGWQKFGVGDYRRVRSHQRGGAEVIQVLRAPFAHVVLAEAALKRMHRDQIAARTRRGMISSGQGTEVTRHSAVISLTDVLPDSQDVTYWFR
jgi:hypothetical protein